MSFLTAKFTRGKLKQFVTAYATDKKTLDLGSSGGPYAAHFPNRTSADIADGPEVDVVADAHDLPFEDESFDCILCTEVLEHLHTPEKAVAEMYRVLRPGGRLVLTTRFVFPIHDAPHDYFRYTRFGLTHLFKNWEALEIIDETNGFEAVGAVVQRLGYQTTMQYRWFSKPLVYLTAHLVKLLNIFIVAQHGDIKKSHTLDHAICTTGYYITAVKSV